MSKRVIGTMLILTGGACMGYSFGQQSPSSTTQYVIPTIGFALAVAGIYLVHAK